MNIKLGKLVTGFFIIVYFLLSIVSVFHMNTYWLKSNETIYAVILSIITGLGIIGALIMLANPKTRSWGITTYIIVLLYEILGNVFYSYYNIDVTSDIYVSWVEMTEPFFNALFFEPDAILIKRVTAFFDGLAIPFLQAVFYAALSRSFLVTVEEETQAQEEEDEGEEEGSEDMDHPEEPKQEIKEEEEEGEGDIQLQQVEEDKKDEKAEETTSPEDPKRSKASAKKKTVKRKKTLGNMGNRRWQVRR